MQFKILTKRIFLIVVISLILVLFGLIFHFVFQDEVGGGLAQISAKATVLLEQKQTDLIGFPVRLKIPTISVDAVVEYVGLTSLGSMDVPAGSMNVGWFDLGPRPGEVGSAVIAGHSGYKNNKPAVFDNLHKLKKGDKIYIEDGKGAVIAFVVRKIVSYDRNIEGVGIFTSNDDVPHLNLVTCTGDWNAIEKTHSSRLVVFADKVE